MILRSVRKPNRRHHKVRGIGTLVVKDRHFLPGRRVHRLGGAELATSAPKRQTAAGSEGFGLRPPEPLLPPEPLEPLEPRLPLELFGAGTGLLSPVLLLFFLFLLFAAGLSAAPSGRSRGLAFVNEATFVALVAFAVLKELALGVNASGEKGSPFQRAICYVLFLCLYSATYHVAC